MSAANPVTLPLSGYQGRHVDFAVAGKVATNAAVAKPLACNAVARVGTSGDTRRPLSRAPWPGG